MDASPLLVSVPEAAKALSLSRSGIYTLIGDGKLRPVKLGRRTLIPTEQLVAIAAS